MNRVDLLMHPVRIRIVLAAANRVLTTRQIALYLPDVRQTTLYRHINLLIEGGVLTVVKQTRQRGATERWLTVQTGQSRVDAEAVVALPPDEQARYFTEFLAAVLADFARVYGAPPAGLPLVTYTRQRLYATRAELADINQQMDAALDAYRDPARQTDGAALEPWLFTGIAMPDVELAQDDSLPDQP
jgi:hypothetical protein